MAFQTNPRTKWIDGHSVWTSHWRSHHVHGRFGLSNFWASCTLLRGYLLFFALDQFMQLYAWRYKRSDGQFRGRIIPGFLCRRLIHWEYDADNVCVVHCTILRHIDATLSWKDHSLSDCRNSLCSEIFGLESEGQNTEPFCDCFCYQTPVCVLWVATCRNCALHYECL